MKCIPRRLHLKIFLNLKIAGYVLCFFAGQSSSAQMRGLPSIGLPERQISLESRLSPPGSSPSTDENNLRLSAPIFKRDDNGLGASLGAGTLRFGQNLRLDDGHEYSNELTRVDLGLVYTHQRTENRNWSLRSNVGYAGDQAFKDLTYSLTGTYGFPGSGRGYWIVLVYLSNNSVIANYIPIPGFAYLYKTPTFSGLFGFPLLNLQWTPVGPWAFSLTAYGVVVTAEAALGTVGATQIFTAYARTHQTFIPHEREQNRDRLVFTEQRLTVGARTPLGASFKLEGQVGQSSQRQVYVGTGLFSHDGGTMDMSAEWTFALNLTATF